MEKLAKYRVFIGIGGCLLAIIGCFLPWASVLGISVNFIDGDGKILLVCAIVSAILIYFKKDKFSLISSVGLVAMIAYPFIKAKN